MLGAFVDVGSNNLVNASAIGAFAQVTKSNSVVLGNVSSVTIFEADGSAIHAEPANVGIGVTAPTSKLHVIDFGHTGLRVETESAGGTVASFGANGEFQVDAVNVFGGRFIVKENGRVGVGTTSPDQTLSVNGNASKVGGGSWASFSDKRLKIIKGRFNRGLRAVMQLQPLRYEYKRDKPALQDQRFNFSRGHGPGVSLGAPSIATVTITDNATEPSSNVIDGAQNFVCEHYHDFLNRTPDANGLAFWTNEIISCGANQACIDLKRINVSAAYFLSIEFQQTGYLVERIYKAAFGDASGASTFGGTHQLAVPIVRLNEFLPDTQRIGLGVIVGQPGYETILESNKQAFALEFVQRSRFSTALPTTLTPALFVNQLFANAGVTPSANDRNAAIAEFGSATNTADVAARARALRDVAENASLNSQEFDRAFVLMQYIGYLRRNPNDAADADYTGYDFWLTKLNVFNGNFVAAEMVKAFITSGEYRQRFGP